jgi:hypothetical protein
VRFCKPRRAGGSRGAWAVRLVVPVLCALAGMLGVAAPAFAAVPLVVTNPATGLEHEQQATLNGTVDPEGAPVTACQFEYGTSAGYGEAVPCAQTPGQIGSGTGPVAVSADVTGLSVPSTYHYRLTASNANGEVVGADETFTAGAKPEIAELFVTATSSTEALVGGLLAAGGLPTTYRVDYGPTEAYGSSTPELSVGSGTSYNQIHVELRGLSPSTRYDARLVVRNAIGVSEEQLESFTTPATPEPDPGLPDHRAYELVSPASEPGEVYLPMVIVNSEVPHTDDFARAAVSGEAVTYPADPAATGGTGAAGLGFGNQFIARRGPSGWTASDFSPRLPVVGSEQVPFEAFSGDLASAVYHEGEGLSPEAGTSAPAECGEDLYDYDQGSAVFTPLFTSTLTPGQCGEPRFVGASESWGQMFFQDEAPLVAPTHTNPNAHVVSQDGFAGCVEGCNLYDTSGGRLAAVNILPDGATAAEGMFGGATAQRLQFGWRNLSGVVAADGSRAFWTDTEPGADNDHIFVRVNPDQGQSSISGGHCIEPEKACTLSVSSGAASYLTATPDGHFVFYLEAGGLWRYDTHTGERQAIAGASASVAGLVGASSDGEWVYFVTGAALTSTPSTTGEVAQPRICESYEEQEQAVREEFEKGEITEEEYEESHIGGEEEAEIQSGVAPHTGCNLFLWHAGSVTFVGDLSPRDNELIAEAAIGGDWRTSVAQHTAYVSPDGRQVVFTSFHALAGVNNIAKSKTNRDAYSEIYMFEAGPSSRLTCVSCRPNGASPVSGGSSEGTGTFLPEAFSEVSAPRWVSEDGSRVFFDSDQPLVADEPSGVQGVYEWEREGSGTCGVVSPARRDGGCISLLSGTGATEPSWFVEADPSGDNVFIETRKQLTGQGTGERLMLYDVRVDGGFSAGSQACTGTGCQGVPPAPPTFATPPSQTFGGAGNFGSQPVVKSVVKPRSAAQRLANALRACRRDRRRRTRERCERKARESYRRVTHSAAKKSTKKGDHHA